MLRTVLISFVALLLLGVCGGCYYTTQSRLPSDIKTISVKTFGNTTFYHGLETQLTEDVKKRLNLSPRIKVVNSKADASLFGEIYKVRNVVQQFDDNDQPKTVRVTISVRYSLYDNKNSEFLIMEQQLTNSQSSSTAGQYSVDKGESKASAQAAALDDLSRMIVRSCLTSKK